MATFQAYLGSEEPVFASDYERECAKVLDYYGVPWEYEPRTFVLERGDEHRVPALVVAGDLDAELADARGDLCSGEIDLPDPRIGSQLASVSLYRWARRSMSRL